MVRNGRFIPFARGVSWPAPILPPPESGPLANQGHETVTKGDSCLSKQQLQAQPLLFSAKITRYVNGVDLEITREDGRAFTLDIPDKKLQLFRAVNGKVNELVAFLLGES